MNEVSSFRLYVLRALYLFIVVGLGLVVWPGIIHQSQHWEFMEGTVSCMLAAFSLLCALGLRYPLQMLAMPWRYVFKHYVLKAGDRWSLPFVRRASEAAR